MKTNIKSKFNLKEMLRNIWVWYSTTSHAERKALLACERERKKMIKAQEILEEYYEKNKENRLNRKVIKVSGEDCAKLDAIIQKQISAANEMAQFMDYLNSGTPTNNHLH